MQSQWRTAARGVLNMISLNQTPGFGQPNLSSDAAANKLEGAILELIMYKYHYIPSSVGFVCEVYDQGDNLLGSSPGFSKKDAEVRIKLKIGIKKK